MFRNNGTFNFVNIIYNIFTIYYFHSNAYLATYTHTTEVTIKINNCDICPIFAGLVTINRLIVEENGQRGTILSAMLHES